MDSAEAGRGSRRCEAPINGEQTFRLPEGKTTIVAGRGPGDSTDSADIEVVSGRSNRVGSKGRVVDMRKLGWLGGDAHVHMIHGENQPDRLRGCRDRMPGPRA